MAALTQMWGYGYRTKWKWNKQYGNDMPYKKWWSEAVENLGEKNQNTQTASSYIDV